MYIIAICWISSDSSKFLELNDTLVLIFVSLQLSEQVYHSIPKAYKYRNKCIIQFQKLTNSRINSKSLQISEQVYHSIPRADKYQKKCTIQFQKLTNIRTSVQFNSKSLQIAEVVYHLIPKAYK